MDFNPPQNKIEGDMKIGAKINKPESLKQAYETLEQEARNLSKHAVWFPYGGKIHGLRVALIKVRMAKHENP